MTDTAVTTVALNHPIQAAGKTVTEIRLRKPKTGELRGLHITQLLAGEPASLTTLIARLADPILTEAEVAEVDLGDFTRCYGAIARFFGVAETGAL